MYILARTCYALQTLMCRITNVFNVFTKFNVLCLRRSYRKTLLTCNTYYFINFPPVTLAHCVSRRVCAGILKVLGEESDKVLMRPTEISRRWKGIVFRQQSGVWLCFWVFIQESVVV